MLESEADLEAALQDMMRGLEWQVHGFRGLRVDRDGNRLGIVFRWFDDPNIYEVWSAARGGLFPWDKEVDEHVLWEELETGLLLRAAKTRQGRVLRIELDAVEAYPGGDDTFYLSDVLEYVGHLSAAGLDISPGLSARRAGTLLGWASACVNSVDGGRPFAQVVTVRETSDTGLIAQLEMSPDVRPTVGLELVFLAIHHAARQGIHRLYSPRSIAEAELLGLAPATDRPGMVVYDITRENLNWPDHLSHGSPK